MYQSPDSASVLGNHTQGWFGKTGLHDLLQVANAPLETSKSFEEMFVCDPKAKYYGYKSWDGKKRLAFPFTQISPYTRLYTVNQLI